MARLDITTATAADVERMIGWAREEGWNPGRSDARAFFPTDPCGFLIGHLDGEPVVCISAVRYSPAFGFIGFYITRPHLRGRGYGIQLWRAGMARLSGRNIGLDGVVAQQEHYGRSGFRHAWNTIRHEGVPIAPDTPAGVVLRDARDIPFDRLAAYDRRFFPAPRDSFLASWITLPGHTSLAAVHDGELHGLGVIRRCHGPSRIGPLYASSRHVAATLISALAVTTPSGRVALDVPDTNADSLGLMTRLGLTPSFETARMYTGLTPDVDSPGIYATTTLELG